MRRKHGKQREGCGRINPINWHKNLSKGGYAYEFIISKNNYSNQHSIVIIVSFIMLLDSHAFYEKYFSLDAYCMVDDDNCDAYTSPFDESPHVGGYTVAFYCDTPIPCLSGTFDTSGLIGSGHWIAIPPVFYAVYTDKLGTLELFGLWFGKRMFGFGKDEIIGYNFLFIGKRTPDFNY